MFDGFTLRVLALTVINAIRRMLKVPSLSSPETGVISKCTVNADGFYFTFIEGEYYPSLNIRGSFHKFYCGGRNDTLFTFKDFKKAVKNFAKIYHISLADNLLQKQEIGVNLSVRSPEAIIDAAVLYHGCTATKGNTKRKQYYKEWRFKEYIVKLYKKNDCLLRFEIRLTAVRQLRPLGMHCLADLMRKDVFVRGLARLLSSVNEFVFVPSMKDSLPEALKNKWLKWQNEKYWGRRLKPWKKSREKGQIQKAIKDYHLVDWKKFLFKKIFEQGAKMLETSPAELNAMFSALGLQCEIFADNVCENLGVKKDSVNSGIFQTMSYATVANVWMTLLRDPELGYMFVHGGRGPPVHLPQMS